MSFKAAAIIVCAGSGKRLGADKPVLKLNNKPLFYHACLKFLKLKAMAQVILVLREDHIKKARKVLPSKVKIVAGGAHRRDSVCCGLAALDNNITHVLIHDGARPFVAKELILKVLEELKKYPAVICGLNPSDTLKLIDNGIVQGTISRQTVNLIQTPQGFKREVLVDAYKFAKNISVYDCAEAVELMGEEVRIVAGKRENIKITYPEDLVWAKVMKAK